MSARECIIPVFVPHLGCPYTCVFCNQNHISGAQEPATPQTVKDAIEKAALTEKSAKRQLAFYGGSFTAIPVEQQTALLDTAREYMDKGIIDTIRLSTRPDAIDNTVLDRLEKYGVETIELGAQSLDEEVLLKAGRGHTAKDVENASRLIKSRGFKLILQMMTGLPGDTAERSLETARKIAALSPDGVRVYPTVIVKDTGLYELWKRGIYKEHTVEDAVQYCSRILPVFEENNIPVIRLGLNPTDDLSGGDAVAGAYHPALGEMVKSRIYRDRAEQVLGSVPAGSKVVIGVDKSCISQMTGQHRCNIDYLMDKFELKELKIRQLDIKKWEIGIISVEK